MLVEKVVPRGERVGRVAGGVLVVAGLLSLSQVGLKSRRYTATQKRGTRGTRAWRHAKRPQNCREETGNKACNAASPADSGQEAPLVHVSLGETTPQSYDWPALVENLNRWLRLRTTPIGMKLFTTVEDMEAIPRIRRPQSIHTTDQIVAMAARLGWTVGITVQDLVGRSAAPSSGCIHRTPSGALGNAWRVCGMKPPRRSTQQAMDVVPYGRYAAMAVSPWWQVVAQSAGCLSHLRTPAQMILFINGLQWSGYAKLQWGCVGESACADSWGEPRHW